MYFSLFSFFLSSSFKKIYLIIFRDGGREGEREGEKHPCVVASHASLLGTWPTTQACALTGNRTSDPLLYRLVLNPLSHTSHGFSFFLIHYNVINTCLISCVPETLSPIHSSFRAHPYNFH